MTSPAAQLTLEVVPPKPRPVPVAPTAMPRRDCGEQPRFAGLRTCRRCWTANRAKDRAAEEAV